MSTFSKVLLDSGEAARLAADCRRVAGAIDEHVALLTTGRYAGVRTHGSAGYRRAVEAVIERLAARADELRAAARGLSNRSSTIIDADRAAAWRIVELTR